MTKSTSNKGKAWTPAAKNQLKDLAKKNTPTRVIGLKTGRSEAAIRSQATKQGTSLKPVNQSPYGTKNK